MIFSPSIESVPVKVLEEKLPSQVTFDTQSSLLGGAMVKFPVVLIEIKFVEFSKVEASLTIKEMSPAPANKFTLLIPPIDGLVLCPSSAAR